MITFAVSKQEHELAMAVAHRALALCARLKGDPCRLQDMAMDVIATHANGCRLRLAELLAADDANFGHDVFGIRRYLNRDTGKLTHCFVPRFAAPECQ